MARGLATIILLSVFLCSSQAQVYSIRRGCISVDAAVEFNSINVSDVVFTRRNVRSTCYNNYEKTLLQDTEMTFVECASAAYDQGKNSFSFESGECELSNFYGTTESSDIIEPAPRIGRNTTVVFVVDPPLDESLIERNSQSGTPSMEAWFEWDGGRTLNLSTWIELAGRQCLIKELWWQDENNNREVISLEEIDANGLYFIRSNEDICHSRQVSVRMDIENADGRSDTIIRNHNLNSQLTREDLSFEYIWEDFIGSNPNEITLRGTIRGALSNLTKVEFYQDGLPIYSEDNPAASLELNFSLVGSVRDNDCSLEFDGYLYDSYGCPTIHQRIVRSICEAYLDDDSSFELLEDIVSKDFCSFCGVYGPTLDKFLGRDFCDDLETNDNAVGRFVIPGYMDRKLADILALPTNYESIWIEYNYDFFGSWDWRGNGPSSGLNSTLFNTTLFDAQPDLFGCSVIKANEYEGQTDPLLIIEKINCSIPEPGVLCLASYSGEISQTPITDWSHYDPVMVNQLSQT